MSPPVATLLPGLYLTILPYMHQFYLFYCLAVVHSLETYKLEPLSHTFSFHFDVQLRLELNCTLRNVITETL